MVGRMLLSVIAVLCVCVAPAGCASIPGWSAGHARQHMFVWVAVQVEFWRKGASYEEEEQWQQQQQYHEQDWLDHEHRSRAVDTAQAAVGGSGDMETQDMARLVARVLLSPPPPLPFPASLSAVGLSRLECCSARDRVPVQASGCALSEGSTQCCCWVAAHQPCFFRNMAATRVSGTWCVV